MVSIDKLENQVKEIQDRNRRVEKDKEWEQSYTRRLLLMFFTYLAIGFYLQAIEIENPWLNAIVPTLGFYLSTLTLPFFKSLWEKVKKSK